MYAIKYILSAKNLTNICVLNQNNMTEVQSAIILMQFGITVNDKWERTSGMTM